MRILHIGNIANNAWQNAKLMDKAEGCENFVLCYDYYHTMGTPEWEEADFDAAEIDDHFFPKWSGVDLHGFRRPESFVQGPRKLSLRYLDLVGMEFERPGKTGRRRRDLLRARRSLELANGLRSGRSLVEQVEIAGFWCRRKLVRFLVMLANVFRFLPGRFMSLLRWAMIRTMGRARSRAMFRAMFRAREGKDLVLEPRISLGWILRRRAYSVSTKLVDFAFAAGAVVLVAPTLLGTVVLHAAGKIGAAGKTVAPGTLREHRKAAGRRQRHLFQASKRKVKRWIKRTLGLSLRPHQRVQFQEFVTEFGARFPTRSDQLSVEDCQMWATLGEEFQPILKRWDIVQAYSTDPIIPMVAEVPYFAFEHGTLREIPFEDSSRGRMTALAYARAQHVFVTNFDCLEKAHQLTGDPDRVTFINHPFDENDLPSSDEAESLRGRLLVELDCEHLVFFPTRHDWVEGKGYNDKANDHLLRAIGDLWQGDGPATGLVLCDWGHNVKESRQLIRELGYERHTKWLAPQATKRFMKTCMACDVVADQFKLGSFGGILFKAMATGTPICTFLQEENLLRIYPEVPPVINVRTREEIRDRLGAALEDGEKLAEIGEAGRRWIENHHSGAETMERQFAQYREFLAREVGCHPGRNHPRNHPLTPTHSE
ncbi:MAG: glycosyltransferase [Verrucomicrobiales bacterium]